MQCTVKATFHYSSRLQTWSRPGFRQVYASLRHAFDQLSTFFVESLDLLHQSQHVEIDAAGSQQVRWFVRMLDKWNVVKTRFEPANEPVEAGFSLLILLFLECTDPYRLICFQLWNQSAICTRSVSV